MKKNNKNYIYGVGKRKSASARVRLFKGKGESFVNNKSVKEYFPGIIYESIFDRPFNLAGVKDKYFVTVRVIGGGKEKQLQAVVGGIAKALVATDQKLKPVLKKAGLLTRDSRIRERRKVGTGGKARRQKQSPKR